MSEIRVNKVINAAGADAPNFPYGFSVAAGYGITGGGNVVATAGTFSGAVNVDATTDSTSSSTGALIVDGGLGVAKNVYIGAGLSVAGTLTYEDVTNVDSVGLITAKSGVNVTGGQLQVGVAYSVGAAGVCTAAGFVGSLTGAASQITVADESSDTSCNVVYTTAATGDLAPKTGTNLTFNSSTGNLTATQLTGTLQTATQSNITEVGTLGALTISGAGEFKVGTAVTISSTAGVTTFSGDVIFDSATENRTITFDKSADALKFADSALLLIGDSSDLQLFHDGSNRIRAGSGALLIEGDGSANINIRPQIGENAIIAVPNDSVKLYWDDNFRFSTTGAGTTSVGISTVQEFSSMGMLKERVKVVANKLSAANNIDLKDGNIYYFTTSETTTATPNIRYDGSHTLNNKMLIGETVTVSIIYKPNGAGYYAALTVDSSAVTEEWNGGSAPSSAESSGYDVLTHTLVKTGDQDFLCLSNVSNFA